MSDATAKDLSKFLDKIDEIDGLVRNLKAADDEDGSSAAIKRADEYLSRSSTSVTQDRSVINKCSPQSSGGTSTAEEKREQGAVTMEQADFMKSIQEDAKERAERRKEREKAGKELKKKGTRAFRSSDYNSAIEFYSKAIQEMPWDITLYTNRALCYNKSANYKEAISDCDKAIRFEPKTFRAYIHKGSALSAMEQYTQAEECYLTAIELFPEEKSVVEGYLKELRELMTSKKNES